MIYGNGFGRAGTFGRFVLRGISDILQAVKVKSKQSVTERVVFWGRNKESFRKDGEYC